MICAPGEPAPISHAFPSSPSVGSLSIEAAVAKGILIMVRRFVSSLSGPETQKFNAPCAGRGIVPARNPSSIACIASSKGMPCAIKRVSSFVLGTLLSCTDICKPMHVFDGVQVSRGIPRFCHVHVLVWLIDDSMLRNGFLLHVGNEFRLLTPVVCLVSGAVAVNMVGPPSHHRRGGIFVVGDGTIAILRSV